ncbi:MAG: SprT-like domain-containing protein [Bacteroidetes bacterium]|uniref:SprT-like domain-containing protein n=1 Tax=Phnomibacter sp. TaxID=2836217 RepID=UPI002FDD2A4B|nr:SprT-like domain-containing protein [Bacteroidota bacterium]
MAARQHPFEALKGYLPAGSFDMVMPLITEHKVHLVITKERQTKLGDFRHAHRNNNHRITVNGNLNVHAFLITLIHELAHLLAYQRYGHRIPPHGKEWKYTYSQLLSSFLAANIFPADVAHELTLMLGNPAASSSAEDGLQRVLRKYDAPRPGIATVEEIAEGEAFQLPDGRAFIRGDKLRKRIRCHEMHSIRVYLFHPLYEVQRL